LTVQQHHSKGKIILKVFSTGRASCTSSVFFRVLWSTRRVKRWLLPCLQEAVLLKHSKMWAAKGWMLLQCNAPTHQYSSNSPSIVLWCLPIHHTLSGNVQFVPLSKMDWLKSCHFKNVVSSTTAEHYAWKLTEIFCPWIWDVAPVLELYEAMYMQCGQPTRRAVSYFVLRKSKQKPIQMFFYLCVWS